MAESLWSTRLTEIRERWVGYQGHDALRIPHVEGKYVKDSVTDGEFLLFNLELLGLIGRTR